MLPGAAVVRATRRTDQGQRRVEVGALPERAVVALRGHDDLVVFHVLEGLLRDDDTLTVGPRVVAGQRAFDDAAQREALALGLLASEPGAGDLVVLDVVVAHRANIEVAGEDRLATLGSVGIGVNALD